MPSCKDCGAQKSREEMFGAGDDLRCSDCARKRRERYAPGRARFRAGKAPVTLALIALAAAGTMAFRTAPRIAEYLVDEQGPVWNGEVWRLFTTVLPHANIFHLLFNLYWVWMLGRAIESWLGPIRYLGLVLLLAVGSVAVSFLTEGPAIGLSGVAYGFFGLLFVLRRQKDFAAELLQPQTVQLLIGWFFLCIVLDQTGVQNIGNFAHGAGAAMGWLIGKSVLDRRRMIWIAAIATVAFCLAATTQYMPWDPQFDLHQARLALAKEDYPAALEWLTKASKHMPDNPDLQFEIEKLSEVAQAANRI